MGGKTRCILWPRMMSTQSPSAPSSGSQLHEAYEHKALVLEAAIVLQDNPTPPYSPAPSNVVGITPTTDYRLADLAATVDGGTKGLHRQYSWPGDPCCLPYDKKLSECTKIHYT